MVDVLGIGGFFFKSKDPAVLAQWYEKHFGINKVPEDYGSPGWQQKAGTTVFAPFDQDTDYFGLPEKVWMINFRVSNLDYSVAELSSAGIDVEVDPETYPNGRFARLADPEGNAIQLWQPCSPDDE